MSTGTPTNFSPSGPGAQSLGTPDLPWGPLYGAGVAYGEEVISPEDLALAQERIVELEAEDKILAVANAYLDGSGSDTDGDGSETNPFRSLGGVRDALTSGKYDGHINFLNLRLGNGVFENPYGIFLNANCPSIGRLNLYGKCTEQANHRATVITSSDSRAFRVEQPNAPESVGIYGVSFENSGDSANDIFGASETRVEIYGYFGLFNAHATARKSGIRVDLSRLYFNGSNVLISGGAYGNTIFLVNGSYAYSVGTNLLTVQNCDVTEMLYAAARSSSLYSVAAPVFTNVTGNGRVRVTQGAYINAGSNPGRFSPVGMTLVGSDNSYIYGA